LKEEKHIGKMNILKQGNLNLNEIKNKLKNNSFHVGINRFVEQDNKEMIKNHDDFIKGIRKYKHINDKLNYNKVDNLTSMIKDETKNLDLSDGNCCLSSVIHHGQHQVKCIKSGSNHLVINNINKLTDDRVFIPDYNLYKDDK